MELAEIKAVLKERKITYTDLSKMSGVPLQTIQKIFAGITRHPRIDTMQAIEHALGLDEPVVSWYMLTEEENALITEYRKLVPAMREFVLDTVKKLNQTQNK